MNIMKTCPICSAKAVKGASTCYECYYRYSDQSIRNVSPDRLPKRYPSQEQNHELLVRTFR